MTKRSAQRGLTLPELMIALLIFGFISSVGLYVLRLGVDGREQLQTTDETLREWQMARLIVRQDLLQLSMRTVRDEFGNRQLGPVLAGLGFTGRDPVQGEIPLLAFARSGWTNDDDLAPRSTLQYVEYVQVGDEIIRRARPYLDGAEDQPISQRVLFTGVRDVEISCFAGEGSRGLNWTQDWPGPFGVGAPRAIRFSFTTERFGDMEQLFWIGDLPLSDDPVDDGGAS